MYNMKEYCSMSDFNNINYIYLLSFFASILKLPPETNWEWWIPYCHGQFDNGVENYGPFSHSTVTSRKVLKGKQPELTSDMLWASWAGRSSIISQEFICPFKPISCSAYCADRAWPAIKWHKAALRYLNKYLFANCDYCNSFCFRLICSQMNCSSWRVQ